ncbi:SpoIIE family protein phosphatase [Nocardia sp. NPDC020380]|uniref:SpoIIE family protein phosphatase n=1 Tax=Nocardia sp. NPDC020380 TaxID=3364309 RepID=UPI003788035B
MPPHSREALPAILAAAVAVGGEMGRRFAEFDWDTHPLGPPSRWPAEHCAAVATALTSRFPIVLWLGARDLFQIYNDAYIPILGDKHPAALGRRGSEVWWDIWSEIGPMLAGVLTTGEATWSDDLMLALVTAGRPVERYFTFSYSPIFEGSGEIHGIFCAVTETTDRVLGERRLGVLNAVAAQIMDVRSIDAAVAAAITVCARNPADLPLVAVYVEDGAGTPMLRGATASVLPLLPRELGALTPRKAAPGTRTAWEVGDLEEVLPGLTAVFADSPMDTALVLPVGEEPVAGVVVIGVSPRRPLDEQYRGFCQLLADQLSSAFSAVASYQQQRRRADELAELDRAKTAFLSNVSHEFRTPLTLLLGPIDDALSAGGTDAALLERLSMARRSAGRLRRLVDSLLDFSRVEAGRAHADPVCADIGALTAHIASAFSELCHRAGLRLVLDCESAVADIDPAMWETIVFNLLSNAVKFTFAGSITVEVRAEAEACRICVRDTGIGIGERELGRIFERFHRGDNTRGRTVEGAGVGLALVRGLVELQGGTIRVESRVDEGAAVVIVLPRSASVPDPAVLDGRHDDENPYVVEAGQWVVPPVAELTGELAPQGDSGPAGDSGERKRVLVVDDNADMRAYLNRVLSEHWDTILTADGRSALGVALARRPDAIVTDVMMPGLDGFAFVAALRADPRLSAIPVIMLSARSGSESASEGYAGGADDYLAKPFASRELVDRVAARLAAVARERDRRLRRETDVLRETAFAHLETALQTTESAQGILEAVAAWPPVSAGADVVAIGVIDTGKASVRVEFGANGMVGATAPPQVLALADDHPMAEAIRSGMPIIVSDTASGDGRRAGAEMPRGARAGVIHPLRDSDYRMVGALARWWTEPRQFSGAELSSLARSAELVQAALHRIRAQRRDRRIALEFQEQLLDLDGGSTAAVVAAVYQPAEEAMRVGGDWYLAVPLDRAGRIGISAGDVVGHGLSAAVVMSRLRAAIASAAMTNTDPAAVLDVVNRYAEAVPGAHCATAIYAVVDPAAQTVEYCCAGHPYPLLMPAAGPPVYLEAGRRLPLATIGFSAGSRSGRHTLAVGGTLLFYTDGLIERPGEILDDGFERLRTAAAECANLPTAVLCGELLERIRPPGGYGDDVVLLALRPTGTTRDSFTMAVPAAADQLPKVRTGLREWLHDRGIPPQRAYDILLSVCEALTNAIEHGSGLDPRKTVSVEVTGRGAGLLATVTDSGMADSGAASPRDPARGRGLVLIDGLADAADTMRSLHGTRVTLRFDGVGAGHRAAVEQQTGMPPTSS